MGDQTQAYDIFQAPPSSGYPLPLRISFRTFNALARADSSTREPRAVFTRKAPKINIVGA